MKLLSINMSVMNWVVYTILIIFTCYIWYIENRDIHCPNLDATKEECDSEGGMSFSHTKPSSNDSCEILLDKINKASGAEENSIKWRRAFILSVAIMFALCILLNNLFISNTTQGFSSDTIFLPDWRVFLLGLLICFSILLGNFIYYSYHIFGVAEDWIKESIKILKTKIKC